MGNSRRKSSARQKQPPPQQADSSGGEILDTGCLICGKDDDHAKILLCESCNGEYHTYCLKPKLDEIPTSSWYCEKCRPEDDHHLNRLVDSLPDEHTDRFGEVCWAQGGVGYGWWPSCIYNPLWAKGPARVEARRHLGKRHLVYFFQCDASPFAVLPDAKIVKWVEGISFDMHMGKAARSYSKERYGLFQRAMQVASMEFESPTDRFGKSPPSSPNHGKSPLRSPTPKRGLSKTVSRKRAKRNSLFGRTKDDDDDDDDAKDASSEIHLSPSRSVTQNITKKKNAHGDKELVCTIWEQQPKDGSSEAVEAQIGFVILPSQRTSTFVATRQAISREIDALKAVDWQFYIPNLGPVSRAQERIFGAIWPFFSQRKFEGIGEGTARSPLCLFIVKSSQQE